MYIHTLWHVYIYTHINSKLYIDEYVVLTQIMGKGREEKYNIMCNKCKTVIVINSMGKHAMITVKMKRKQDADHKTLYRIVLLFAMIVSIS